MSKVEPGYYFFAYCLNCKGEVIFGEAPSPEDEDFPKSTSIVKTCPHCGLEHTHKPREMGRGIFEE